MIAVYQQELFLFFLFFLRRIFTLPDLIWEQLGTFGRASQIPHFLGAETFDHIA